MATGQRRLEINDKPLMERENKTSFHLSQPLLGLLAIVREYPNFLASEKLVPDA
jgi:hypothetical protein